MVSPAQRHRELITHLATECTRLRKTQMMRIRRTPTTNQAGLFDDKPNMVAVTNPAWFRKHQDALVNLRQLFGQGLASECSSFVSICSIWRYHFEFGREDFPHLLCVYCRQLVFCHQPSLYSQRGFISRAEAVDLAEQFDS